LSRWLDRLGLHRPELRAWALYDVANSAFMTTVIQLFQLFFPGYAAVNLPENVARSWYAFATSGAVILVGLLGPLLGAIADVQGNKKKWLGAFVAVGAVATAAMYLIGKGEWQLALWLFVIGNVAVTSSLAFYNSLLPQIASPDEVDRVSTAGFALGYLGGGLLLALNLVMIQSPERFGLSDAAHATRVAFLTVGVWWALFSIPLFLQVKEPPHRVAAGEEGRSALRVALGRLKETVGELRYHKDAGLLLLAFLIYNDAVNTIIRLAVSFGDELRFPKAALVAAVLMIQFVGVPFAFLFGALAGKIGPKKAIYVALAVYCVIAVYGYSLQTTRQFYVLAFMVAMVMGGIQALSRSLFATLVPRHKSAEMFGFFGIFDRFGGAIGALIFGIVLASAGTSRPAIVSLLAFFVIGGLLLAFVDVDRGRRAALEAEARATT
jgi:MFS transporter, UMF1 family